MEIETKNASLDTMAVTIMALHVSGKQMTQAVFKQLPYKDESDKSELWGIVRYSIKDQADIWLVFSESGTLFRRGVNTRTRYADKSLLNELQNDVKRLTKNMSRFEISDDMTDYLKKSYKEQQDEQDDKLAKAQMDLDDEIIEYNDEVKAVEKFNAYEKRLLEMPQLFIAV